MRFKRIFVLILDSLGVGEASDANDYGDNGANTLKHIIDNYDIFIPNLKKLGFLNTINMDDNPNVDAYYTIAKPTNIGKDSISGHYEIIGLESKVHFRSFSIQAFPRELIETIENTINKRIIGNKVIDGESILEELGDRHINYGSLILYTSGNSTLEIAAHEDVVPISKLYSYCEAIRKITQRDEWRVARVIARPFNGKNGKYKFTNDRKDYTLKPNKKSILNHLKDNNYIVDGEGITKVIKASTTNIETINKMSDIMSKNFTGVCITDLSEFDSSYGHKKDINGYAAAIEELDVEIPLIINRLNTDDILIITADHGNDPTFENSFHTRENVPVIIYGRNLKNPKKLPVLETMADIGATIADNFGVDNTGLGKSFLDQLK